MAPGTGAKAAEDASLSAIAPRERIMAVLIGPFFYIHNRLIFNACPLSEGRRQADKIDNSYSHERLYDDFFEAGEYIDYPRGRVVWDCGNNRAVIYIDPCINRAEVVEKLRAAFDVTEYVLAEDDHYHCKQCAGALFDNQ